MIPEQKELQVAESAGASLSLRGCRVMVVDDSEAARLILRQILEREGALVSAAADGAEAVEQVRHAPTGFDLILMDVFMDKMDGIDAIREIRRLPNGGACAICAMSSGFTPALKAEIRAAGGSAELLGKPYDRETVGRVALAALGKATEAREVCDLAERRQAFAAPEDVAVLGPGIDIEGALARCCDDSLMLLQMLHRLSSEGYARIVAAQTALRDDDAPGALRQLHTLRGEVLNLGMAALAARLVNVESTLAVQPINAELRQAADLRLAHIGLDLTSTVASICQLPALRPRIRFARPVANAGGAYDEAAFVALVAAMRRQEAKALRMAPAEGRLLPPAYPEETERSFRKHFVALDFPAALDLLGQPSRVEEPGQEADDRHRILVVDDTSSTVRLLCTILAGLGSLRFALSAEHALTIARQWKPELVVADVRMGQTSGVELCRLLKEDPQTARAAIILMSADNEVATEVEALAAGAADFIEKPLNPARVIGRINTHLSNLRRDIGLGAMPDRSPFGFITCSTAGEIMEMSPAVANLLGRPIHFFKGQHLTACFIPASADNLAGALDECSRTSMPVSCEVVLQGPDLASIPMRLNLWAAPGTSGRVLLAAVEDMRNTVTAERKAFDARLSHVVATIAGGIAHEFNNLFSIAIGNLDLLPEAELGREGGRYLAKAKIALDRASEISRRLSDSTRREAGVTVSPVAVDDLVDEYWPMLAAVVSANVQLSRVRGAGPLRVRVPAQGLRECLVQLVQNACEAMPSGGRLVISSASEHRAAAGPGSDFAVIEVRDNGVGMAPEVAERAFDPFFTLHSPARVGLGLSNVRSFMTSHGGSADIRSVPGAGTVVRLRLPAATSSA
jgi:CheY-like chemotaxis protein